MIRTKIGRRATILGLIALTTWQAGAEETSEPRAEFRYQAESEQIVLSYRVRTAFAYYGEPAFGFEIYGDGRTVVMLPEDYPRRPFEKRGYLVSRRGFFETRLTPQEIEEILRAVEPALLIDVAATKAARLLQHPGRASTDGANTEVVIDLDNYRPANGTWQGKVSQVIAWHNIHADAKSYPGVPGIQKLRAATRSLPEWVYKLAARVDARERNQ